MTVEFGGTVARHGVIGFRVGLCGGVFQNRVLAEQAIALLEEAGFDVFLPRLLPCNDAALSLGQAAEVAAARTGVGQC